MINDDDIDNQIQAILRSQGNLVAVTDDRGIEKDDYAIINYQGFEGEEAVTGMKAENYSLSIGTGNFYPGFDDGLLGVKKGDKKDITIDFKEDYINPKLAGKSIKFEVEVTDTGHGISGDNLERIFDPFFTTKKVGQGTGLGLSISYGIIRDLKGSIRAYSRKGKGASFVIKFPSLA